MPFDFFTLADHLQQVITNAEADLRLEQAVYGLDSKDEKEFLRKFPLWLLLVIQTQANRLFSTL